MANSIEYPSQHTYDNLKRNLLYTLEEYKKTLEPVKTKTSNNSKVQFIGDDRYVTNLDEIIIKLTTSINFRGLDTDIIEEISDTNINDTFTNYHTGYMDYLLCAWQQHLGIQVGPWHLWNILLWNLKEISKSKESDFKSLWTNDASQSSTIDIASNVFDINLVKIVLNSNIPSNTIKALDIDFDVNTPSNYTNIIYSLLGDNSSEQHINTIVLACNIPKVIILGDEESWILLVEQIKMVRELYAPFKNHKVNKYLVKVESYFNDCVKNFSSQDYWLNFFNVENCGSGHQKCVSGHIKKLFIHKELLLSSMPNIISKMEYNLVGGGNSVSNSIISNSNNINNNSLQGRYISGVLASVISDDNVLIPSFCHITTTINLANNIATPSRIQENIQLVKACSILNNYSRSPIYHHEITEETFYRYYDTTEVILGLITMDEFIKRLKTLHGDAVNEEATKDNIEKLKKQHIDSDRATIFKTYIIEKMHNLETKHNFWFKNISSLPWKECQRINLTTELWLNGRMRQTTEDIKLVCDNLNHIMDNLYLARTFEKKSVKIERIILSTYNEDIYHNYVSLCSDESNESDDEFDYDEETDDDVRFDIDDNYVTSITVKTLSRIIHFLLMNIRVNGSPLCSDYLNFSTHTDLVCESLITGLMLKYNIDTCIRVYNRLVRDRIIPIINKVASEGINELQNQVKKIDKVLPSSLYKELVQLYQYLYILRLPIKSSKLGNVKTLATMTVSILEKAGFKARVVDNSVIIDDRVATTAITTNSIIPIFDNVDATSVAGVIGMAREA